VLGAGSAGTGICALLLRAVIEAGETERDARGRFYLVDRDGLLVDDMPGLQPFQAPFAQPRNRVNDWTLQTPDRIELADVVANAQPTVLIGTSGQPHTFTEDIVRAMARHAPCPIIFPLSNPTDKAECTPKQAYEWTDGKALVAAGVQFPDVTVGGKTFHPGQANNFYIFPAIGLAVYATRPKRIDDRMFIAAARGSADQVSQADRDKGMLFPRQNDILETELTTATRVAEYIFEQGQATVARPDDIRAWIKAMTYKPVYGAECGT
jgi:malate dehydrogenase (oxaloacetate-decarboxylating)(NADP+)